MRVNQRVCKWGYKHTILDVTPQEEITRGENPHAILEHECDFPKLNVFCAISYRKICGPFFFAEATVTGATYLDMLEQWLLPQLEEDSVDFIFQHDGAPPPPPHITITTFRATSMTDCHNDGLAVQLRGIKNCCIGHHIPQISSHVIPSCGVTSRIVCLYHHLQTQWLMCAMLHVERTLHICNASEKNSVSFPFYHY
jgi:hypothetical protein